MKNRLVLTLAGIFPLILIFLSNDAAAQSKVISALIKPDSAEVQTVPLIDTLGFIEGKIRLVPENHAKSGSLAMLLSAVLPGAGQVYAHRYYTIPIIWGFGIYFYSLWIQTNSIYKEYQGKYSDSLNSTTVDPRVLENYRTNRDDFHDHRDGFAVYMALTYLLNIVDAYVGATLYSFDVSDNLGGSAAIRFRIPLH